MLCREKDIIDEETPGRGLGVPNHSSVQLLKELIGMKGHRLNHLQWTSLTLKCLLHHYEALTRLFHQSLKYPPPPTQAVE